jgi:hypothetical protein
MNRGIAGKARGSKPFRATGRDVIINTSAWTNMSVEQAARTGADKSYFMACWLMFVAPANFAQRQPAVRLGDLKEAR